MDRDALATRLMGLFLVELEDHEQTLERALLALEREQGEQARRSLVENAFRAAHSLKGAARAVHAKGIETTCHRLESALAELRDRPEALDSDTVQSLLAHVDGVRAAGKRLRLELASEPAAAATPAAPHSREPAQAEPAVGGHPANSNAGASPPPRTAEPRAVRVATRKLDALVASSGELLVSGTRIEARLEQLAGLRERAARELRTARGVERAALSGPFAELERELDALAAGLRGDLGTLSAATRQVDHQVRGLRMVPFGEACEGLERSVRDLAQGLGKDAVLSIEGERAELDRELAQRLRDPLLHLVRNALSHGLELPAVRARRGKPRAGSVSIRADVRGSLLELSIADDGGGFDLEAIRERARALALPEPVDDAELADYAFEPGLSTMRSVSEVSGRGVGLDAVKRGIEALHGSISVTTRSGQGVSFTIRLPLTLSKLRLLHFSVAGQAYAVPTSHALRVLRFRADQLLHVAGRVLVRAESELVQVVSAAELLGLDARPQGEAEQAQALVLSDAGRSVALIVELLLAEREGVIHQLPARVAASEFVSGAAVLARGEVALVLSGSELARAALASARPRSALFDPPTQQKRRVLVVDDSITTRALIKAIVEEGGYDVTAARDGVEALRLLREQPFDLVVSDVQMPNLDGFGLTERIRRDPKLMRIPVVLVTSLEGEHDRLRGLEAGASAYLGKSAFDHRVLLEVLGGLS